MAPRQYQTPLLPNRYSVAAAIDTARSWETIMLTLFVMAAWPAPEITHIMED